MMIAITIGDDGLHYNYWYTTIARTPNYPENNVHEMKVVEPHHDGWLLSPTVASWSLRLDF
jgi:hypothetical protein